MIVAVMSLKNMQDLDPNPYKSPLAEGRSRAANRKPFLTKQRLVWAGLVLIFLATGIFTCSHSLYVESFRPDAEFGTFAVLLNALGVVAFIVGASALTMSAWRREPTIRFHYGPRPNGHEDSKIESNKK